MTLECYASIYSLEEQKTARGQGMPLYAGTWQDWLERCQRQLLDCEIHLISEMMGIYQLSQKLFCLQLDILWGWNHARKTSQSAGLLENFQQLQNNFQSTFSVWHQNWLDYGTVCTWWHPYQVGSLGPVAGYLVDEEDE